MTSHQHRMQERTFRIDVTPGAKPRNGREPRLFVARILRVRQGRLQPICDSRGTEEVYGPTERWALKNAIALLESGAWQEVPTPREPSASMQ